MSGGVRVAIIGFGEVGQCFASALAEHGAALSLFDPNPSEAAHAAARRIGRRIGADVSGGLADARLVICAVPGAHGLSVARAVARELPEGALYADLTTARPAAIREAPSAFGARADAFVDVAIMGAISLAGHRTPLLGAGPRAAELQGLLAPAGFRIEVLTGKEPGDASALKLLRSVFTKGLEALAVECLVAAEGQGLRNEVIDQLRDLDETPIARFLDMLVRTHVLHAARRLQEVEQVQSLLSEAGYAADVTAGVHARFEKTRDLLEVSPPARPDTMTLDGALDWLLGNTHAGSDFRRRAAPAARSAS
jgi:3-hydroxyisobutyrate dehydrogenase